MATLLKLSWILDTMSPSTVDIQIWRTVLVTKSTNESLLLTLLDACIYSHTDMHTYSLMLSYFETGEFFNNIFLPLSTTLRFNHVSHFFSLNSVAVPTTLI